MPIFTNITEVVDPDEVPRPVVIIGMTAVAGEMELDVRGRRKGQLPYHVTISRSGMWELDVHQHRKAQLLYITKGTITCEDEQGLWIVPPQCALWIPSGARHKIKGSGIEGFCMFVDPETVPTMPGVCGTVSVCPLLRELLVRCAHLPALYALKGAEARIISVLLDELVVAPLENLHLPMPKDARLLRLFDEMTANPADRATMPALARRIGLSPRTLSRLLFQEAGLSFGRWRQQLHIILALQWLSQGESVQAVSIDLGYENASSFVIMFRKALGTSPARYMAQRLRTGAIRCETTGYGENRRAVNVPKRPKAKGRR